MKEHYNILSLDGGGIRGLILLKQLIVFEDLLGIKLHEHFDLISGTSTGGIIAAMLSLGHSANDILSLYTEHGSKIFHKQFLRFGIFRPKYSDKYFNKLLMSYVGDKRLKDINKNLLIVSYNATLKDKEIFIASKAKLNDIYDYSLFDVIRSTSSAPSFFKPHKINNNYFVDGGLVINNPSLVSWIESFKTEENYKNVNIISFSTGKTERPLTKKTARGGMLSWAKPSVDILLAELTETTDYQMEKLFVRESGIYIRCNSMVQNSSGEIDDVRKENLNNMLIDGEISAKYNLNSMKEFINKSK